MKDHFLNKYEYQEKRYSLKEKEQEAQELVKQAEEIGLSLSVSFIKEMTETPSTFRYHLEKLCNEEYDREGGMFAPDETVTDAIKEKYRTLYREGKPILSKLRSILDQGVVSLHDEEGKIVCEVENLDEKAKNLATHHVNKKKLEELYNIYQDILNACKKWKEFEQNNNLPDFSNGAHIGYIGEYGYYKFNTFLGLISNPLEENDFVMLFYDKLK